MTQYLNFINGTWQASETGKTLDLVDPTHATIYGSSARSDRNDTQNAIDAAVAAAHAWRLEPAEKRADVLRRSADHLRARTSEAVERLVREQGKLRKEAEHEVRSTILTLEFFAGEVLQPIGDVLPPATGARMTWSEEVPVGICVAISPWNFPLLIPSYKIAPAIAFGNTAILKPAEVTPGPAAMLVEAFEAAELPPGVLNLVLGPGQTVGDALVNHNAVRAITFTGSTPVGRGIATATAGRDVRLQLEMGGKNPAVILEDADLDLAVELITSSALGMAGQRCTAVSRVIVQEALADELGERLASRWSGITMGDPLDLSSEVGPLISEEHRRTVEGHVSRARASGIEPVVGGSRAQPGGLHGFFFEPTLFLDVDEHEDITREEVFGPVVTVTRVRSVEESVRVANDSSYGLTSMVCTRDLDTGLEVIRGLETGMAHINREPSAVARHVPFGGAKSSGAGEKEQGKMARRFFTTTRSIYVA